MPDFEWNLIGRLDDPSSSYVKACFAAVIELGLQQQVKFVGESDDIYSQLSLAKVGVLTSKMEAY